MFKGMFEKKFTEGNHELIDANGEATPETQARLDKLAEDGDLDGLKKLTDEIEEKLNSRESRVKKEPETLEEKTEALEKINKETESMREGPTTDDLLAEIGRMEKEQKEKTK